MKLIRLMDDLHMDVNTPRRRQKESVRGRGANPQIVTNGIAQLSVVEHALCPLDPTKSNVRGMYFDTGYFRTDKHGNSKFIPVEMTAGHGLVSDDEFYIWGMLQLAFAQPEPNFQFRATPYYCLRQLGLIDTKNKGGSAFQHFRDVLKRVGSLSLYSKQFWHPDHGEEREVTLGFLRGDMPTEDDGSRLWTFTFDPNFFDYCNQKAGALRFDLETYRQFDCAGRRVFLNLSKMFHRRTTSPKFDLYHLGTRLMGLSPELPMKKIKQKVARCIDTLAEANIVTFPKGVKSSKELIRKKAIGSYELAPLARGTYFDQPTKLQTQTAVQNSPLYAPLKEIGFNEKETRSVLKTNSRHAVELWVDITTCAMKKPQGFPGFKCHPKAFFLYHISRKLAPPDWWHAFTKNERRRQYEREHQIQEMKLYEHRPAWKKARTDALKKLIEADSERYQAAYKAFHELHTRNYGQQRAHQLAIDDATKQFENSLQFPELELWIARHKLN